MAIDRAPRNHRHGHREIALTNRRTGHPPRQSITGRNCFGIVQFKKEMGQLIGISRLLMPILTLPVVIAAAQSPAEALITVRFSDDGPNLKVSVSGSLSQLPAPLGSDGCGVGGAIGGEFQTISPGVNGIVCTGPGQLVNYFSITGPSGYGGNSFIAPATSVAGSAFWLISSAFTSTPQASSTVGIDPGYPLGAPYLSEAIFAGTSLASQGFPAAGFTGTWTINGTSESIAVIVNASTNVPSPLSLLGAGAALAWSRRLRKRISTL